MLIFLVFLLSIQVFTQTPSIASQNVVSLKENAVKAICDAVRTYYTESELETTCPRYESCTADSNLINFPGMLCQPGFGTDDYCSCGNALISKSTPTIRYAPGTDKNDKEIAEFVCFTSALKGIFTSNYASDPSLSWQYIGSPTGSFNMWPGKSDYYSNTEVNPCKTLQSTCPSYDPRIRPWYIASASGAKDIVLVLDISGSMTKIDPSSGSTRLQLLKDAASTIIDGLGYYDRISIVTFNIAAQTCLFSGDSLVRGDSKNRDRLKNCIDQMTAFSETNFKAGFEKAFSLLRNRLYDPNICHTVILFLTDGVITNGATGNEFLDFVETENNDDLGAKIFTFSLGLDADTVLPKALACSHKGVWIPIEDGNDLRTKMSGYYNYFTYSNRTRGVTWSERYYDFSGLGWMTTAAMGCFSDNKKLVGVAGVDVLISEFEGNGDNYTESVAPWLFDRSHRCYDIDMSENVLEGLRQHHKCVAFDQTTIVIVVVVGLCIALVIVVMIIIVVIVVLLLMYFRAREMPKHVKHARKTNLNPQPQPVQNLQMNQVSQVQNNLNNNIVSPPYAPKDHFVPPNPINFGNNNIMGGNMMGPPNNGMNQNFNQFNPNAPPTVFNI